MFLPGRCRNCFVGFFCQNKCSDDMVLLMLHLLKFYPKYAITVAYFKMSVLQVILGMVILIQQHVKGYVVVIRTPNG